MSDRTSTVSCSWSNFSETHKDGGVTIEGFVATKYGYVAVYSTAIMTDGATSFNLITEGRFFTRRMNRFYSQRYLVTLATRFAKECSE